MLQCMLYLQQILLTKYSRLVQYLLLFLLLHILFYQHLILKQIHDLQTQYPQTIYASLASLEASKYHIDHKAFDAAESDLHWIVQKGSTALQPLASLRLARLYLEQNAPQKTITLLNHFSSTDVESALIKGYAYLALKSSDQALNAFKQAVDNCEENSEFALCDQARMQ